MLWIVILILLALWVLRLGFAVDGWLITGFLIGAWLLSLLGLLFKGSKRSGNV